MWAEISEKISDAYGQGIKYGEGEGWALDFLAKLSKLTEQIEVIDTKLDDYKIHSEKLHAETLRQGKSARKVVEHALYQKRMLFYSIQEHFLKLKNR